MWFKTELTPLECERIFDYWVRRKRVPDIYGTYDEFVGKFSNKSFKLRNYGNRKCSVSAIRRILSCRLFCLKNSTYILGHIRLNSFCRFDYVVVNTVLSIAAVCLLVQTLNLLNHYTFLLLANIACYAYESRRFRKEEKACVHFVIANFKCHKNSLGISVEQAQAMLDDFLKQKR